MERAPDADPPDMPGRTDSHASNVAAEEREIDQILADSFPASDAPPWTLGVAEPPPDAHERRAGTGGIDDKG